MMLMERGGSYTIQEGAEDLFLINQTQQVKNSNLI